MPTKKLARYQPVKRIQSINSFSGMTEEQYLKEITNPTPLKPNPYIPIPPGYFDWLDKNVNK